MNHISLFKELSQVTSGAKCFCGDSTRLAVHGYEACAPTIRTSERGELLKYMASKINKPIGYVAMRLKGMDLQTLYFMKSQCDAEEKRGVSWSKVWFGSLKVRN